MERFKGACTDFGPVIFSNTEVGCARGNPLEGSWPWDAHKQCATNEDHRVFISKARLLRGVGGNGANVCNIVAFLERWDGVDVQYDAGHWSAGFEYKFAEVIGDKAHFHALLNIGATLHE